MLKLWLCPLFSCCRRGEVESGPPMRTDEVNNPISVEMPTIDTAKTSTNSLIQETTLDNDQTKQVKSEPDALVSLKTLAASEEPHAEGPVTIIQDDNIAPDQVLEAIQYVRRQGAQCIVPERSTRTPLEMDAFFPADNPGSEERMWTPISKWPKDGELKDRDDWGNRAHGLLVFSQNHIHILDHQAFLGRAPILRAETTTHLQRIQSATENDFDQIGLPSESYAARLRR
ncbi:hypothetical protein FVEG_12402 [Fusarium verticillioides 7600]|uniref:Uncharacterized protein n=1 Tax=Gibberella moniliformis (strain M3125 / FGSC 7600) TaxID=334819 RepID=W7MRM0_GIBM7|nr:hypothetical protein FVEG_12402 [Fusarium verticillioides 7600]EWG54108.1 hypothetical protein FVEG_12402 [Fusarium verticillioides 7600]